MAKKKIGDLDPYGSVDLEKALKDEYEVSKNEGTYGTPDYPAGSSRKQTLEQLRNNIQLRLVNKSTFHTGSSILVSDSFNVFTCPDTSTSYTFSVPDDFIYDNKPIIFQVNVPTGDENDLLDISITGVRKGSSTINDYEDITITNVNQTLFLYCFNSDWRLISISNQLQDLSNYATIPYVDSKIVNSITPSDSTHAPDGNSVYEALLLKENVSNKTNTIPGNETSTTLYASVKGFFDYLTGMTWLTGSIFGTWYQTLSSKTTPVDADTISLFNSASSFTAVKVTLTNFLSYLYTKLFKFNYGYQSARLAYSATVGELWYQTDGTTGWYGCTTAPNTWVRLASASNNIRIDNLSFLSYLSTIELSFVDAGTITSFTNLSNKLSSASYIKYTYSAGTWTAGSSTAITFTSGVSTVSISMASQDYLMVTSIIAYPYTSATLAMKTIIS